MTEPLRRLIAYAKPYRARLTLALVGMLVYAGGSAGLAALVKQIFDSVLPNQAQVSTTAWEIVGAYVLKGIGSYISAASSIFFFVMAIYSMVAGKRSAANPWGEGANTLEWTVASPAPYHTFSVPPQVR